MTSLCHRVGVALVLVVLASGIAAAAPSTTRDDKLLRAKELFRLGTAAYDTGRYTESAKYYEDALDLVDLPAFLFNIGQAYRLGGNKPKAIAAYRGFVRRVPNAPERAEAERYVRELSVVVAPVVVEEVIVPPPPKPPLKKWVIGVTVGAVVVVVGVGLGVGLGLGLRPNYPTAKDGRISF